MLMDSFGITVGIVSFKIMDPMILGTAMGRHGDVNETTKCIGIFVTSISDILPFIYLRGVSLAPQNKHKF
jgi:hypothetical protein